MATQRLVIIPYLQEWDGSILSLRLLLIPRGSPISSLIGTSPSFATAHLVFDVFVTPDANSLPVPGGSITTTVSSPVVVTALPVFNALATQFEIDPNPTENGAPPVNTRVRKQLPLSYQKATGYAPGRTSLVSTDQSYFCAFKHPASTYTPLPPPNPKIPWGRVIAFLLRNSGLAEAAGLIRIVQIPLNAKSFKNGAFIYMTLSSTSDAAALKSNGVLSYAARIPALIAPRDIFTSVLFPVAVTPPNIDYGDIFAEVEDYDDGFAKAVHCAQPQQLDPLNETQDGTRPAKELGVRIGWDDEQVTIWMNRQLNAPADSPIGVQGYRIDTRITGTTPWNSLAKAAGPIGVNGIPLGTFNGELAIETHPVQFQAQTTGDFWLPLYFASWSGPSLVTLDDTRIQLAGGPGGSNANRVVGLKPAISLLYGKGYDFRVRLSDHTGGGPAIGDAPSNPGPSPVGSIPFRRWIRPLAATINDTVPVVTDPVNPPASISLKRPLLFYPSVACTGYYPNVINQLLADLHAAKLAGREPGLPDPDVDRLQITIEVRGLTQDPTCTDGPYIPLITTTRSFPSDTAASIILNLAWTDIVDVYALTEPATGPILLPTARDIRLSMLPLCRDDPNGLYFGADDVRYGRNVQVSLRKNSGTETNLFVPDLPSNRFSAYFFQPDVQPDSATMYAQRAAGAGNTAPKDLASRMSSELRLRNNGLTLRAQPGRRVVFGCTPSINHFTGPDLASITFSSQSDIALHWFIMIKLTLNRDWSWDQLAESGIVVQRDGLPVGAISPNRNVNSDALASPQRLQTDLIFFDAIDPKPVTGTFPQELTPKYTINYTFKNQPVTDAPLNLLILLPITTPPAQVPEIVSAGIAMSPYTRAADYSSTGVRTKALWIELSAPPADPRDRFFARVLRNGPDPILSSTSVNVASTLEPPLPIDPEPVRKIVQGQADDKAGLDAMQLLTPSDDPLHWSLPLPPGMTASSPQLFGFFTYELRVGHFGDGTTDMWSTAQGRFGAPLRVAGVQHPAPPLALTLQHTSTGIAVSAPFAAPILDGVSVQPIIPKSTMWVLLYAQAEQIDGQDKRNILLSRKHALPPGREGKLRFTNAYGEAAFPAAEVATMLANLGFVPKAPLSVLAVEMLPQDVLPGDPLGADLGSQRILRTSPLVPVPGIC
ncbi:hypothetical protein MMC34_001772 [Xylographa carneopallida]|nr:hypothetical protein [Xylographa carneopallida]